MDSNPLRCWKRRIVMNARGERRTARPGAVLYKGRGWALGTQTSIHEGPMSAAAVRVPIDISELRHEDGAAPRGRPDPRRALTHARRGRLVHRNASSCVSVINPGWLSRRQPSGSGAASSSRRTTRWSSFARFPTSPPRPRLCDRDVRCNIGSLAAGVRRLRHNRTPDHAAGVAIRQWRLS